MKYLILLLITVNFSVFANNEKCKQVGELAKEIMIKRQAQKDVFKLLPLYKEDQAMVLDAYETPTYNGIEYLSNAINARNSIIRADEIRKHDEETEKYRNSIMQFKLKYIKLCLQSK